MVSQKQQYTVLYGRLSQEDERVGESNSILHQRDLLESYAQAKGFENTLFLAMRINSRNRKKDDKRRKKRDSKV